MAADLGARTWYDHKGRPLEVRGGRVFLKKVVKKELDIKAEAVVSGEEDKPSEVAGVVAPVVPEEATAIVPASELLGVGVGQNSNQRRSRGYRLNPYYYGGYIPRGVHYGYYQPAFGGYQQGYYSRPFQPGFVRPRRNNFYLDFRRGRWSVRARF